MGAGCCGLRLDDDLKILQIRKILESADRGFDFLVTDWVNNVTCKVEN